MMERIRDVRLDMLDGSSTKLTLTNPKVSMCAVTKINGNLVLISTFPSALMFLVGANSPWMIGICDFLLAAWLAPDTTT